MLLTLAERKSREYWMLPIKNREADSVMEAFQELQETYSEHFGEVFKTITTDNGSEFSKLSELEEESRLLPFCHFVFFSRFLENFLCFFTIFSKTLLTHLFSCDKMPT